MSVRLASGAVIYMGANVANAAIPFLLMPLLTRVLTPADYGAVAMFTLFVTVAGAVIGLSMHGAIGVRYFQLEREHFARYIGSCLRILCIATAAAIAVVIVGEAWFREFTQLPGAWLIVGTLVASATVFISMRLAIWQMQHRAVQYGTFQVGQSLLNMGLSLFFVLGLSMAWQGRVLGQALTVLTFVTLAALSLPKGQVARPSGAEDSKDILRFGLPLIPHVVGSLAIGMADRVMIVNMLDLSQAGIYTIALQIGMGLGLLTDSFNRVYAPWLMETLSKPAALRDERIVRGTYLYFAVVTALAIALGLAAPWLLGIIVGPAFREAASSIFYIAMGFAFGGMYYMVTNYVFYKSRTPQLAMITLASGAFNIAATWYLIRLNGALGAAQGFMLSQAALFLGTWLLAHRSHPMPWVRALWPAKSIA